MTKKTVNLLIKLAAVAGFCFILVSIFSKLDCKRQGCPECPKADVIPDTIPGDSVPYPVKVKVPDPVYRDTGSVQWRDRPVDTNAILADYFARYFYSDTITDDTSFLAIVLDTVSQNRIISRRFLMQNLRPVAVINNYPQKTEAKSRRLVYAGMEISGNTENLFSFGPAFGYKDRKDHLYILGSNLLKDQPNVSLGCLLPIRLSRN